MRIRCGGRVRYDGDQRGRASFFLTGKNIACSVQSGSLHIRRPLPLIEGETNGLYAAAYLSAVSANSIKEVKLALATNENAAATNILG